MPCDLRHGFKGYATSPKGGAASSTDLFQTRFVPAAVRSPARTYAAKLCAPSSSSDGGRSRRSHVTERTAWCDRHHDLHEPYNMAARFMSIDHTAGRPRRWNW